MSFMAIPYLACMALVAAVYHLPPRVLPAIQAVEGGTVGNVSQNLDGSADLGVMQVNTLWLPALSRVARLTPDETQRRLVFDPCFNIAAAGLIMREYLNETHGDLMQSVGDYHSHTFVRNHLYQEKVVAAARRLFVRSVVQPFNPGPSSHSSQVAAASQGPKGSTVAAASR
jgi:hypothetical protein